MEYKQTRILWISLYIHSNAAKYLVWGDLLRTNIFFIYLFEE